MVSPPALTKVPAALSPPAPTSAQLPKKRTSDLTLTSSQPKRRKPSNWSQASAPASAHPLRQTSFPPEPASPSAVRSPSVDAASHVSSNAIGGSTAPTGGKKKRGRKSKNAVQFATEADGQSLSAAREKTPSLAGGKAGTNVSGSGAPETIVGTGGGKGVEEEDEEDDEVNLAMVDTAARTKEQKEEEMRLRAMLAESFDKMQFSRFEQWRAAKLGDAPVRRIINTAVSQSVPGNIVLAVKSVSKLFIGQIIEQARQVQADWIAAGENQTEVGSDSPPLSLFSDGEEGTVDRIRRGPLRPDHLREAWRRYRANMGGEGVGAHALWHVQNGAGPDRFATRTGKRLFR